VTKTECNLMMEPVTNDIKTIKKALVGEDLKSGLVKDVADIKSTLKTWQAIKNIIIPIIIAVSSALITAYFLGQIPHP